MKKLVCSMVSLSVLVWGLLASPVASACQYGLCPTGKPPGRDVECCYKRPQ